MGTLKFRFVDGKSVLYYETDGTVDGTYLYYCPLEDCAMWHNFVRNNRCIDSWFCFGQIVLKGEPASDYFKLLVREDRILTEEKKKEMDVELFLDRADVVQIKDPENPRKFIFLSQNEKAPLTRRERNIIKAMLIAQFKKNIVFEFRVGKEKPKTIFIDELVKSEEGKDVSEK